MDLPSTTRLMTKRPVFIASRSLTAAIRRLLRTFHPTILGAIDVAEFHAAAPARLTVAGWAFSDTAQIAKVEVWLDSPRQLLGPVFYGLARPDVLEVRPWQSRAECGYAGSVEFDGALTDHETIIVSVTDTRGVRRDFRRAIHKSRAPEKHGPVASQEPFLEIHRVIWRGNRLLVEGCAGSLPATSRGIVRFSLDEAFLGTSRVNIRDPDVKPQHAAHAVGHYAGFRFCRRLSLPVDMSKRLALLTVEYRCGNAALARMSTEINREGADRPTFLAWERLEHAVTEFEVRYGRYPAVLDWNTGLELAAAFPECVVFSPPAAARSLPYLDHSIDIVAVPSQDMCLVAEARRVAQAAVIILPPAGVELESRHGNISAFGGDGEPRLEWFSEASHANLPSASIIIPVYGGDEYTEGCLTALNLTVPSNMDVEIIVVDDGSGDQTGDLLETWAARDRRLKILRNSRNSGFIESCNRGALAAKGEILVFLNNDTIPQSRWLPPLLRVFRDDPTAGAVGGKLLFPDGRLQEAGGVIFSDGSGLNFGKFDEDAYAPLYNYLREVDYCSGALLATRRNLFLDLRGFDTRYCPAYFEDADYCFSVRERGFRVYYQPESEVIHVEGGTSGTDLTSGMKHFQMINRPKFVEKWSQALRQQPAPPDHIDFAVLQALAVRNEAEETEGE